MHAPRAQYGFSAIAERYAEAIGAVADEGDDGFADSLLDDAVAYALREAGAPATR